MAIRKSSISGTPSGNTASRPANPEIGATYNNGTLGVEEIYTSAGWVAKSAPPAIPTITSVSQSNSVNTYAATSSASVAFTSGEGGGLANSYTVTSSPGSLSGTGLSPITINGLTNGTSYTFTATASNNFNTSNTSIPSTSLTPSTIPQSPNIGTLSDNQSGTVLNLTFTEGANGGKSITNYKYQLNNTGSFIPFSPAQTTSPLTFSGLTTGTSYTVKIKAVNENGDSLESSSSNSATPTLSTTVDYLVVAGGGGGNRAELNNPAGGGGAGGYRTSIGGTALTLSLGPTYTVQVGGGGAGDTGLANGGKGTNSIFASITSTGGGGGGKEGFNGSNGGSGGGDASVTTSPGAGNEGGYTPVEGNAGGNASGDGGGGGGGAGGAAADAPSQFTNGSGGIGSNSASSWASITSSGVNGYFAGGGGGGSYNASNNTGTGGAGGGGDGKSRAGSGGSGTTNTGGGGGAAGGGSGTTGSQGGNGGSGIIIIKYPNSRTLNASGGLTTSTYTDSGFKYTKFTAGTGTISFS